jgi:thioredoxin 1
MVRVMRKILILLSMFLSLYANELDYKSVIEKIGKEGVVLELGASTCKACKEMKIVIDELKKTNETLPIHIVDIKENRDAIARFKIQMIPTQVVLDKSGKEVYRHVGGLSGDEMLKLVEISKKNKG